MHFYLSLIFISPSMFEYKKSYFIQEPVSIRPHFNLAIDKCALRQFLKSCSIDKYALRQFLQVSSETWRYLGGTASMHTETWRDCRNAHLSIETIHGPRIFIAMKFMAAAVLPRCEF